MSAGIAAHLAVAPRAMTPVDALQTALAAQHAALYVYGALGARTSQSATPVLFAEVSDAYAVTGPGATC